MQIFDPKWTRDEIDQYTSKEFEKSITKALVSKILKEGEKRNSIPNDKGVKTIRPTWQIQLEDDLFL